MVARVQATPTERRYPTTMIVRSYNSFMKNVKTIYEASSIKVAPLAQPSWPIRIP